MQLHELCSEKTPFLKLDKMADKKLDRKLGLDQT